MSEFPRPVAGSNAGDGSPLVLGDETATGDLFTGAREVHVVDWDGDGEREIVASGGNGEINSFRIVDFLFSLSDNMGATLAWTRGDGCRFSPQQCWEITPVRVSIRTVSTRRRRVDKRDGPIGPLPPHRGRDPVREVPQGAE